MLEKFLALRGLLGGGGSGGGAGGGVATGTMTFAENKDIRYGVNVKHNLGYIPQNALWFVVDSTSVNGSYLIGSRKAPFSYISPAVCTFCFSVSDSTTATRDIGYSFYTSSATGIYAAAKATETEIRLFANATDVPYAIIPAGSTVRWLVW